MRSVSFKTVGCRLNQAETAELKELFEDSGFEVQPFGATTDAVIIHTCAVTQNAEKDCIRIARSCARREKRPFIVLAGCAAEVSGSLLKRECAPDMIVGQDDKFALPGKLAALLHVQSNDPATERSTPSRTRAIVKVQTGCDFHCSYCIVPSARGKPVSLPEASIIARAQSMADRGFKEVVLTGANLGRYGNSPEDLIDLLKNIEKIKGIERIRLSSIEITTAESKLVDHMKTADRICRHLHVPLQSGSNSVLARMNRRYKASEYREFCESALQALPDLALGTDIIVGFPGETEREFEESRAMIADLPYSNIHVFQYSERSGTPAAEMSDQVPAPIKKERSKILLELASQKKSDFARTLVGKECEVLIERMGDSNKACGWTSEYVRAEIAPEGHTVNEIVRFSPTKAVNGIVLDS